MSPPKHTSEEEIADRLFTDKIIIIMGGVLLFLILPLQILFRPNILIYATLLMGMGAIGIGASDFRRMRLVKVESRK